MKEAIVFLMGVMMLIGVSVVGTNDSSGYLVYNNPSHGIQVKYPEGWKKQVLVMEERMLGAVLAVDEEESFNIVVQDVPSEFTLNDYTELSMEQINMLDDVEILDSGEIVLSGMPGFKVTYQYGKFELISAKAWMLKDGKSYLISYSSFPENFDSKSLNLVLESFMIV